VYLSTAFIRDPAFTGTGPKSPAFIRDRRLLEVLTSSSCWWCVTSKLCVFYTFLSIAKLQLELAPNFHWAKLLLNAPGVYLRPAFIRDPAFIVTGPAFIVTGPPKPPAAI